MSHNLLSVRVWVTRTHPEKSSKPHRKKVEQCGCFSECFYLSFVKGLVHPKMKIRTCFTHPQGILGVYDFLLSDESDRSHIKNCPGASKLNNNGNGQVFFFYFLTVQKKSNKVYASIIKCASHSSGRWIKASFSESISFCKKNICAVKIITLTQAIKFFSLTC